ncbi:hypothetical protein [Variovorax sp. Root411]|uniref:hypothetical protein n=1 Tax=Variovorax sp. Root411 TaxID=1736530 RepID=UPI0012F9337A|nr:hypothetical protein [Variovorax sp. Root411]
MAVSLAILAAALGAHAEVVRCIDASGAISYTNVACPPGSKQSRQVAILESPPGEARRPDYTPAPGAAPVAPLPAPSQVAGNPPSGPAIIPRYPADTQQPTASDPPGVVILSPDPYYDGVRPIRRQPQHARDSGPPPGQRPCQNLAGIKRNNC